MSVTVRTFNPRFNVRVYDVPQLKYTYIDTAISGGIGEQLKQSINRITINRRIGDGTSFSLVLYPVVIAGKRLSWESVLSPMNYIEIDLTDPNTNNLITVLRGFISNITRTMDISGGTPQEMITITGTDWAKIAMFPVYSLYLNQVNPTLFQLDILNIWNNLIKDLQNTGTFSPSQLMTRLYGTNAQNGFFYSVASQIASAINATTFVLSQVPVINVPKLYIDTAAQDGLEAENILQALNPVIDFVASSTRPSTSIMDIFRAYQAAPWREFFFEDYPTSQYAIYKPAFWYDSTGQPVQTSQIQYDTTTLTANDVGEDLYRSYNPEPFDHDLTITPNDYESYSLTRSDASVHNAYFTYLQFGDQITFWQKGAAGLGVGLNNPVIVGKQQGQNFTFSDWHLFGIRFREEQTVYVDFLPNTASDKVKWDQTKGQVETASMILNVRLAKAMNHNETLTSGSITTFGNPNIHLGTYVLFAKDSFSPASKFYVEGYSHTFVQPSHYTDGAYLTSITVTRGEDFLDTVR